MNCYSCRLSGICKIYEAISIFKDTAKISVENCIHFSRESDARVPEVQNPQEAQPQQIKRTRPVDEIASVADRIRSLYDRAKENTVYEVAEEDPNEELTEEDLQKANNKSCKDCGDDDYHYLHVCEECKQYVCEGCGYVSADGGKFYCEPCWDKI